MLLLVLGVMKDYAETSILLSQHTGRLVIFVIVGFVTGAGGDEGARPDFHFALLGPTENPTRKS